MKLLGTFGDHLFEMLAVVFDLLFELPLMQGTLKARHDDTFQKRFDEIVVCA